MNFARIAAATAAAVAPYRKALAAAAPSIVGLGVVVMRDRLGIALSETEVQLLYVVLGCLGVTTTAGVFTVRNGPK